MVYRLVSRRSLVSAAAVLAAPAVLRAAERKPEYVSTQTALGLLRGARADGVDVYKGVAYGGDVSVLRRFLPAAPALAWRGVRDALAFGPAPIQPGQPTTDENCLNLNVWAPSQAGTRRPVVFLLGGQSFATGSAADPALDAAALAREHDLVVVAADHRLGLLGHLYLGELGGGTYDRSGNQGLWDLRLALRWVHDNITAFGGDPDKVILFGEGGGGARTTCLYAVPSAAPLFAGAAIGSGPVLRVGDQSHAAETTRLVLKTLGLGPADWRKLIDAPAADLLKAQQAIADMPPQGSDLGLAGFGPILDAEILPHHPFDPAAPVSARKRPLLAGWSAADPEPVKLGMRTMIERKTAQNAAPVYAYALEADGATEGRLRAFLAGFAHTGRPAADGQPDWSPYTPAGQAVMRIGAESRLEAIPPPPPPPHHRKRFGIL